jgi:hypothetical protein
LYRNSNKDAEINSKFLKQWEAHTRDYVDNFERYGGTPILTPQCYDLSYRQGEDYLIPHMVANEEGDYCHKRGYRTSHHNRPRQDNSLGELTRKFVQMIRDSQDLSVDLNEAATQLNV